MDLKDFTKQTLVQIVKGVADANAELNNGAYIPYVAPQNTKRFIYEDGANVIDVDFDVAITALETEGANGGGGIKVMGVFNTGGEIESRTENQTVSRVKYTIPLVLGSKN